jgi:hypothetical protein
MARQLLGPREQNGTADSENKIAAGSWTVTFAPKDTNFSVPLAEVFHIAVNGPGGYFLIYINEDFWDAVSYGGKNGWDPSEPMLIRPGDTVYFFWSTSSGTAPQVTIWLRA